MVEFGTNIIYFFYMFGNLLSLITWSLDYSRARLYSALFSCRWLHFFSMFKYLTWGINVAIQFTSGIVNFLLYMNIARPEVINMLLKHKSILWISFWTLKLSTNNCSRWLFDIYLGTLSFVIENVCNISQMSRTIFMKTYLLSLKGHISDLFPESFSVHMFMSCPW